jgi:hypothetical protein
LLDSGLFREAGKWTLSAPVTEGTLSQMYKMCDFILDKVDEFVRAQKRKEQGA